MDQSRKLIDTLRWFSVIEVEVFIFIYERGVSQLRRIFHLFPKSPYKFQQDWFTLGPVKTEISEKSELPRNCEHNHTIRDATIFES